MSYWTNNPEDLKGGDFKPVPEGDHMGRIAEVKIRETQAGPKQISLKIALNGGFVTYQSLNLEHPNEKAKDVARKSVTKILNGGYLDVPQRLETLDDVARALAGLPVSVTVKNSGRMYKDKPQLDVFFNSNVPQEQKVSFSSRSKDY